MNQCDAYERVVASLNEAMVDDARWPETSALIDEACGAKGSILTFGDEPSTGNIDIFFARSYWRGEDRSEWLREYFRHYHAGDEHLPRLRTLPDSKIVPIADLFSERERRTSLAYNEAMPRFEFQHGLNVRLDGPFSSRIVWGIGDPVDTHGWGSSRVEMIARLLPHLRQYVRVRSAFAEAQGFGAAAIELLENTRVGVVQLDRRRRIVEMNDVARSLLRRNDGLSEEHGALRAATPEDDNKLGDLLVRALPRIGEESASGSMTVSRAFSLPKLTLHVKPVTSREGDYRARDVAALVVLVDPSSRFRVDPDLVASILGLTPAEAGIAVLLAEGRTARQIAAATGRQYSTVRTHLKRIFSKLRVSRQYEAAQAVLALSDLPESRDHGSRAR